VEPTIKRVYQAAAIGENEKTSAAEGQSDASLLDALVATPDPGT
jgi:hypothetical protein